MGVYILSAGGRYKVGYSDNLGKRIKTLQTGCPWPIEVLNDIPSDQDTERMLHMWLKNFRVCGEWFEFPPNIVKWLKELTEAGLLSVKISLFLLSKDLSVVCEQSKVDSIRKNCLRNLHECWG